MTPAIKKSLVPILFAAIALALVFGAGCFRHQFDHPGVVREAQPRYARWHHHLVFGIIQATPSVNLSAVCPQGTARVANHIGPIGWVVGTITAGIYIPTSVVVWCRAEGGPANAATRGDSGDRLAAKPSMPAP